MTTTTRKACPVSLAQFTAGAPQLSCSMGSEAPAADTALMLEPRQFSTGSIGLWGQGKVSAMIGGLRVPCQVGATFTVVGSKTWSDAQRETALAGIQATMLKLYFHEGTETPLGSVEGTTMAPFSTGSFGWNVNGKIKIGTHAIQVGVNVTVIGSKEAARI
jgi:hypothetical protein